MKQSEIKKKILGAVAILNELVEEYDGMVILDFYEHDEYNDYEFNEYGGSELLVAPIEVRLMVEDT